MTDSVYKVIELVGTSSKSWEEAARVAVEREGAIAVNDAITLHLPPQRVWQHGRPEVERGLKPVQAVAPS